jgi:hypothetical protein
MSVLYVVIYKKTSFMPPKSRGRSTTRNQPKGPRSHSTASTKTEHSEHARHPNDQQNRGRSSSRNSTHSVKSNRSTHKPNREPTTEELERQEFHKNQQALINEVISQMAEKEMLKMLNNLHTKGKLDSEKCARAVEEYKQIGADIKQEWDDARLGVGYYGDPEKHEPAFDAKQKQAYDLYWRKLTGDKMSEFRKKYHLPPALPRSAMEEVVRKNIHEIAVRRMLDESKNSDGGRVQDATLNFIGDRLKNHMQELKKQTRPTPYKPDSQQSTNAGQGAANNNGDEEDTTDAPGGVPQPEMDSSLLSSTLTAFAPTLWPTEAYTRGESLRYL